MSRTSGGTASFQQWFSKSSAMMLSLGRSDPRKGEPIGEVRHVKAPRDGSAMRRAVLARGKPQGFYAGLFELIRHLGYCGLGAVLVTFLGCSADANRADGFVADLD